MTGDRVPGRLGASDMDWSIVAYLESDCGELCMEPDLGTEEGGVMDLAAES